MVRSTVVHRSTLRLATLDRSTLNSIGVRHPISGQSSSETTTPSYAASEHTWGPPYAPRFAIPDQLPNEAQDSDPIGENRNIVCHSRIGSRVSDWWAGPIAEVAGGPCFGVRSGAGLQHQHEVFASTAIESRAASSGPLGTPGISGFPSDSAPAREFEAASAWWSLTTLSSAARLRQRSALTISLMERW